MANTDSAAYVLRFNQVTNTFEYDLSGNWVPPVGGTVIPGSLTVTGTTSSFSPPVLTTTQRDALTPTEGMVIYNVTTHKLNVRTAAAWEAVTSA